MGPPDAPLVVLVHGWASWAGSMLGISRRLSQLGYKVLSFDLPAHGYANQTFTNLLKMAQAIQSVLAELNPKQPFSVIAHSLGAAAVAHLMTGHYHQVDHLVYLAAPDSLQSMFETFAQSIGLNKAAYRAFEDQISKLLRQPIRELCVSDFTTSIAYRHLSLIHSKQDRVIPFRATKGFVPSLPHSRLYALDEVGHYRMLWSEEVWDLLEHILVDERPRIGSGLVS
ncbi:MAG: alpha/beta hydrolase [Bacteroidota bacterium]